MLRIHLFGGLRIALRDRTLPPIPSSAARSLLAYCAYNCTDPHPRQLIIGQFYPDLPESRARRRLSQALWQIRNTVETHGVETPLLIAEADLIRWNQAVEFQLDVHQFDQAFAALSRSDGSVQEMLDRSTSAVDLYQGDLLEGFYDDWILLERERLKSQYESILHQLIQIHKSQGDYEPSLTFAYRLLHLDSLKESVHCEIMRLLYLLGRTNEALRQYDELRTLMDNEFGAEPSAEARELYMQIASRSTADLGDEPSPPQQNETRCEATPASSAESESILVGRTVERQALVGTLDKTLEGVGSIALIEGEPGIGKTRLLEEVASDATWRGLRVLWGRGREITRLTPYSIVREILTQELTALRIAQLEEMISSVWLAEIAAFMPALADNFQNLPARTQLAEEQDKQRFIEAIRLVLGALGQLSSYLIIIDDLQWVDADSLEILDHLNAWLADKPFAICIAYRGEEARANNATWDLIRTLDLAANSRRLVLTNLLGADVDQLMTHRLGTLPNAELLRERLQQESGGNPLFVLESLRALQDAGHLTMDERGRWTLDDAPLRDEPLRTTPRLQQVVANRMGFLDADSQQILQIAATLGVDFNLPLLQRLTENNNRQLVASLERLLQRNFLTAHQQTFGFNHDQIRQSIYEAIDPETRQGLHQRVGNALEESVLMQDEPEKPALLGYHFVHGAMWDKAVTYYQLAGDEAVKTAAFGAAAEYYTQSLQSFEHSDHASTLKFDLHVSREAVFTILGRTEACQAELDAMAKLATTPLQESLVCLRRFWFQLYAESLADAEESARDALAFAQQGDDQAAEAAALIAIGTALDRRSYSTDALPYLRSAINIYQQLEDPRQEALARLELANALSGTAEYSNAIPELQRSRVLYHTAGDLAGEARLLGRLGAMYMERGESDEAENCFTESLRIAQEIGYLRAQITTYSNWANLRYVQNRISDFLELSGKSLDLCVLLGRTHEEIFVRVNRASVLHGMVGEYDLAREEAAYALQHYEQMEHRGGQAQCLELLGSIACEQGDYEAAQTYLERALEAVIEAGDRWLSVFIYGAHARLAEQLGNLASGLDAIAKAEAICQELALTDQQIVLQGMRAKLLIQQNTGEEGTSEEGTTEKAVKLAQETLSMLNANVQQSHKVAYYCYEVLDAAGHSEEAAGALSIAHKGLQAAMAGLSPEQQQTSLRNIADHAAILRAWEASTVITAQRQMIRIDVPTGRPATDDEWIQVTVTVSHPEDQSIPKKKQRRQHQVLRIIEESVQQGAAPTVEDLATLLEVGAATVKRDLAELRKAGQEVKTRGSRATPTPQ